MFNIIFEFGSLGDGIVHVVDLVVVKYFPNPSVACVWKAHCEVRGGDHTSIRKRAVVSPVFVVLDEELWSWNLVLLLVGVIKKLLGLQKYC